ncbi:MAG: class I SAM-dependent methyltransferase [Candidatus Saccharimonadaceae bacterium]
MEKTDFTIDAYNDKAEEIAAKFESLGARVADIDRALQLAEMNTGATVVELGSGGGRDAAEIIKRVNSYVGVEPSEGMITIARQNVPSAQFVQETAQEYEFGENIDVVFAFASLLHVDKNDLTKIINRIHAALRKGGILYMSFKESDEYEPFVSDDRWGKRQFYLYNLDTLQVIAGDQFELVYENHKEFNDTKWLTAVFMKV